jgi:general stress protein 26
VPDWPDFAALEDDHLRITTKTVFCPVTTVDEAGRPRSRMLHPIFAVPDGRPLGWALTGRTPLKTRHIAANPHVSCACWTPSHDTVFVDTVATWVEDDAEKAEVWELFLNSPTPLGWGPEGMAGQGVERWRNPVFRPVRPELWRVQVMTGDNYPRGELTGRVWRA